MKYYDMCKIASNELAWQNFLKSIVPDLALEGAGAGLAMLTGAAFGPVGVGLFLAGLGYSVYQASQKTNDNLTELIEHLDSLDRDGTQAEKIIDGWIKELERLKPTLQIPFSKTKEQELKNSALRMVALRKVVSFLELVGSQWGSVKPHLKDFAFLGKWGDIGEVEITLKQTIARIKKILAGTQSKANAAANKALKEIEKKNKYMSMADSNITDVAKEIIELYVDLTAKFGAPPKFDTRAEKYAYNYAKQMLQDPYKIFEAGEKTSETVKTFLPYMVSLRDLMKKALKQKTASIKPPISKRALTLGDGTKIFSPGLGKSRPNKKDPIGVPVGGRKKIRVAPNKTVKSIQKNINRLMAIYVQNMPQIEVDGLYGPQTGGALSAIMYNFNEFSNMVKKYVGLSPFQARRYYDVKRKPKLLKRLDIILQKAVGASHDPEKVSHEPRISRRQAPSRPVALDDYVAISPTGNKYRAGQYLEATYAVTDPKQRGIIITNAIATYKGDPNDREAFGQHLYNFIENKFGGVARSKYRMF